MKKKSITILCFGVVIAVILNIVAFVGFNIAGFQYGGMLDPEKGIRKGIDLAGGSVITLQAETENPTDDQMNVVESIFQTRLTNAGYTESRISKSEGGKITVEIPSVFDTDSVAQLLGAMAQLKFVDADGVQILDGATDIKDASYQYSATQQGGNATHHVQVEFAPEAKAKFAEATRKAAAQSASGKNYISIMMDDTVVSSPRVSEEINSDSCVITGDFTAETAQNLANQIKSGQLPFNLSTISQETVGAELGADALPTSLMAAAIGILLIMIFMVVMYRIPGLIADLSLLIYVGLIGLAMGLMHTNLSLSGIAGIVLSIGMAVDADCIIFERMKEELRTGKTIKASVEAGFNKAFSAILDSNVTTIITCVVLYISGIGTVTGFATTLGVGVVLSMFTAIVITKFFLKQLVNIGIKNRNLFCKQVNKEGGAQ
ncbi:MAG: protein translocase subunit SecD [bacterium]|nr:protein translocase subunit SecD [bacterium]